MPALSLKLPITILWVFFVLLFRLIFPIKQKKTLRSFWCALRDLNPHALALEPKSSVSANSTKGARYGF